MLPLVPPRITGKIYLKSQQQQQCPSIKFGNFDAQLCAPIVS